MEAAFNRVWRAARTDDEMGVEKIGDAEGVAPVATVYDSHDFLGLMVPATDATSIKVVGTGEAGSDNGERIGRGVGRWLAEG